MQIGSFIPVDDGYVGRLQTLILDVPLRIVPNPQRSGEKAPDWRVHLAGEEEGPEVGSGWTHDREGGGTLIALQLDCPTLSKALRANLLPSRTQPHLHILLWSRSTRRRDEA